MTKSIAISFEDLGVVPCNASNKRKMIKPIFAKISQMYKTIDF